MHMLGSPTPVPDKQQVDPVQASHDEHADTDTGLVTVQGLCTHFRQT